MIGGRFDLVILDRRSIPQRTLKNQRVLCGIEIGLNRSYNHFEKDYASEKFVKEARNDVSVGYVLHFVRGFREDWKTVVQNIEEAIKENDCFLVKLVESDGVNALAVKIIVENCV